MTRFAGRSFVVTGGTAGIGPAHRRRGRPLNKDLLAAAIEGMHALANDASQPEAATALAQEAKQLFGEIDGAYLNAGIAAYQPLSAVTPDDYRKIFDISVAGVLFGAQALAPLLKRDASLLLMASQTKAKGLPGAGLEEATAVATFLLSSESSIVTGADYPVDGGEGQL